MSQAQSYYKDFRESVKLRTTKMAVPISGGLDSTLIIKALHENNDIDKCVFVSMLTHAHRYVEQVAEKYNIRVHTFECRPNKSDIPKMVEILEEPLYAMSVNYYLYECIHKLGLKVSMSGLGADELLGGYDYYDTERYPRGLFKAIEATDNEQKKKNDLHFLVYHHLRENDKIGLYWQVEGRYPFLDRNLRKYEDIHKSMIKEILLEDFPKEFVFRKKDGFRIGESGKEMYIKQLKIWLKIFA